MGREVSMAERHKRLYENRKEQGLCVKCGINKAREGKVQCEECSIETLKTTKKRYDKIKNTEAYKRRMANYARKRREKLRSQGLCIICKKPSEHYLCFSCSVKRSEKIKERKEVLKNENQSK